MTKTSGQVVKALVSLPGHTFCRNIIPTRSPAAWWSWCRLPMLSCWRSEQWPLFHNCRVWPEAAQALFPAWIQQSFPPSPDSICTPLQERHNLNSKIKQVLVIDNEKYCLSVCYPKQWNGSVVKLYSTQLYPEAIHINLKTSDRKLPSLKLHWTSRQAWGFRWITSGHRIAHQPALRNTAS